VLDKLAKVNEMKKTKSKEFLYSIDRGWLMGDPGDFLS